MRRKVETECRPKRKSAMAFEKRDNSGSLFRNDKKDANDPSHDKFADYTGQIMVAGQEFWLNAWLKTAKNGNKYFSMSIKPKDQQQRGAPQGGGGGGGNRAPQRSQQSYDDQRGGGRGGGDGRHSRDYDKPIVDDSIPF